MIESKKNYTVDAFPGILFSNYVNIASIIAKCSKNEFYPKNLFISLWM